MGALKCVPDLTIMELGKVFQTIPSELYNILMKTKFTKKDCIFFSSLFEIWLLLNLALFYFIQFFFSISLKIVVGVLCIQNYGKLFTIFAKLRANSKILLSRLVDNKAACRTKLPRCVWITTNKIIWKENEKKKMLALY